jgi:hypothetical protein
MSNSLISFNTVFPMAFVIVLAASLLAYFVYREFQRKLKFLTWRVIASSVVVTSLLGLLLNPAYQAVKKSNTVLLLTKGYLQTKVDSLVLKHPELKIIRTKEAAYYSNSSILKSWHDLSNENILCVIGQGIPSHALAAFHHTTLGFIPASLPEGVTRLIIPNDIYVNARTSLHGTFNALGKMNLKLIGPGGDEDSTTLGKGEASFSLSFSPKQSGNFIYSLVAENEHGSTSIERLPIVVLPERQLRLLFIQKFPTAEVRYLKNFLSGKNNQVGVRYQVSKSNFTYEYANMPRFRIDHLTAGLLNSFDLLFIDQKSYDDLSTFEKTDLKKSINNGLGIILLLNDPKDKLLTGFFPVKSKPFSADTAHLRLSSRSYVLPSLPIELRNVPSLRVVTRNKSRVLSGYVYSGLGKIGIQFIQETFRLVVEGNTDDYASLWVTLIGNTARTKGSNFKLRLITPFPYYANEPIEIEAISSGLQPFLVADSARIPMKENALVDDYWTGESWAGQSNWHQLSIRQDSTQLHYFVSDTSEWKSLKISNQIKDNRVSQNFSNADPKKVTQHVQVPAVLFYFLFLFSSAFLWLVPKI